jgi:hypothetical protein
MITLTTAATQATTVGGANVDTANIAVVSRAITEFIGNSITITIPFGQWASPAAFVPSNYAAGDTLFLDLTAGTYKINNGTPAAIPTALLNQINTVVKNYRNGLESLANQSGAAPGTITPW